MNFVPALVRLPVHSGHAVCLHFIQELFHGGSRRPGPRTRLAAGYLVALAALCAFVPLAAACGGPAGSLAHLAPAVSHRRAGPSSTSAIRSPALPAGAPRSVPPSSLPAPRTDWAVPGSVIRNLDIAPGSPYRPGEKVVALTFDDGPSPVYTLQILRILAAAKASASFEIAGKQAAGAVKAPAADPTAICTPTLPWSGVMNPLSLDMSAFARWAPRRGDRPRMRGLR